MAPLTSPNVGHRLSRTPQFNSTSSPDCAYSLLPCSTCSTSQLGGPSQHPHPGYTSSVTKAQTPAQPLYRQCGIRFWRGAGRPRAPLFPKQQEADFSPLGKPVVPGGPAGCSRSGPWGLLHPHGFCISFLVGVSAVFGVRSKRSGRDQSLAPTPPRLLISPKKPKPHGGTPLPLCGVMCHTGDGRLAACEVSEKDRTGKTKTPA